MTRIAFRGDRVDIGGRALRVLRAGPVVADRKGPLVVCEHGAFGCGTDWAVVQAKLAARGLSSLAYDRAGIGHSDPAPAPRDGRAINDDLEALLGALGETGPILLVGHSMGGLMVRLFALERARAVAGIVFVDAVTPEVLGLPGATPAINAFGAILRAVSHGARLGMMVPVSYLTGNLIGLPTEAAAEKRRIHASAPHARGAAAEVTAWPATSRLAGAAELPTDLPIAVITAGPPAARGPIKALQEKPAKLARQGHIEHVTQSTHANVLGPRFADAIVRGVEHVLAADG